MFRVLFVFLFLGCAFCVPCFAVESDSDTLLLPDSLKAVDEHDRVPEENEGEDEENEGEINEDSLKALATAYDLIGLNQHIGVNGISLFVAVVQQFQGRFTSEPKARSFGAGLTGDILTGLSFVHLVPMMTFWTYSEEFTNLIEQRYSDASLGFNAVLLTPRMGSRRFRFFTGAGPSFHLSIILQRLTDEGQNGKTYTTSSFQNGVGFIGGFELPLTNTFTFTTFLLYRALYDWDVPYRRYLMLSTGIAF